MNDFISTLGDTVTNKCHKQVDALIGQGFTAGEDLAPFTAVRIYPSTGKVVKMSGANQVMLGITRIGAKADERVTVDTPFSHLLKVKAGVGGFAVNDEVQITGYDATLELNIATLVGDTDVVIHGLALESADADDVVVIGVYLSPAAWKRGDVS